MLSPKNKRRVLQILPFGLVSALFGFLFVLIEKGVLGDATSYPSTGNPYHFNVLLAVTLAFTLGLVMGCMEVLLLNRWFQKSSFSKKIIYKTITYIALITIFILISSIIRHSVELALAPWNADVWRYTLKFMSDLAFLSLVLYIALGVGFCLFYLEVSDNIGQSVLINFFVGKYHQPIQEERIFMFLDMKASTTIAEQLGHIQYFNMLKEYYADLSDPIIQHGGEIYQYVGDEVIVTWKYDQGKLNNHCLDCFFAMQTALSQQSDKYHSVYGVIPTFKAGIHLGEVTSGEIGVIKRDITFSGDVLNTTARIQGLCNQYQVDLLVSEKLMATLQLNAEVTKTSLGEVTLRGRNQKISLFTIKRKDKGTG